MELIRTVMLNVIAIVFLTTLLDVLLPEGNMRGYLKMTMGFFVVLTLMQPAVQLFQPEGMLQKWQLAVSIPKTDIVAVQGDVYGEQRNEIDRLYQEKIEEQVTSLLLLSTEMDVFQVFCDVEDYCIQKIRITAAEKPEDTERLVQALSGYYGLEPAQIVITMEEAEHYALE